MSSFGERSMIHIDYSSNGKRKIQHYVDGKWVDMGWLMPPARGWENNINSLAERVIALGVPKPTRVWRDMSGDTWEEPVSDEDFLNDWHVVGALMKKCYEMGVVVNIKASEINESLARAFIKACCNALEVDNEI